MKESNKSRRTLRIVLVFAAIGLFSAAPHVARAQCPMCKGALAAGTDDANRFSNALNKSILVMLAAPYVLFAGICGLMYRAVRRARYERELALEAQAPANEAVDTPDSAPPADTTP
jgi:hypothetical protein